MSQHPLPYHDDPLWLRIASFAMDQPDAVIPFSSKLATTLNWSADYTARAIEEYKRFMYLCCISPTGAAPSHVIDEVWHLHLTYTIDYWQRFCRDTLGKDIHHHPSTGGEEQNTKHHQWYADTLSLYASTFHESAPADIWPKPHSHHAVTLPANSTPLNYFFKKSNKLVYLLTALPFLVILICYNRLDPSAFNGPHFLVFYTLLIAAVIITTIILAREKRRIMLPMLKPLLKYAATYDPSKLTNENGPAFKSLLSTLVHDGLVQPTNAGPAGYTIDQLRVSTSTHPLAAQLREHTSSQIDHPTLLTYASRAFDKGRTQIDELRKAFDYWYNLAILPVLLFAIGGHRLVQGFTHDKPVLFLICLVIGSNILLGIIITANNFSNTCKNAVQRKNEIPQQDKRDYINGFIALGAAGFFTSAYMSAGNNSTSYCGGSSCGGSGGCSGGGCGGCGGD